MESQRQCSICGSVKPLSEYYFSKKGPQSRCKPCQRAYIKAWRTVHQEEVKERKEELKRICV